MKHVEDRDNLLEFWKWINLVTPQTVKWVNFVTSIIFLAGYFYIYLHIADGE